MLYFLFQLILCYNYTIFKFKVYFSIKCIVFLRESNNYFFCFIIVVVLRNIYKYKKVTTKLNKKNKIFDKNKFLLLELVDTSTYFLLMSLIIIFRTNEILVFLAFLLVIIWYLIYLSIKDRIINNQ